MAFDACSHIWHATVAYLDGVFCEYLIIIIIIIIIMNRGS